MTPHLQKEFRTLALPAGVVLAALLAGAWGVSAERTLPWQAAISIRVALLAFFLGTPLIAALSFGAEFQHKTMILLLSEPVSRARIWFDKWLSLVSVIAVLTAMAFTVFSPRRPVDLPLASAIMFVVMVVCSAPLWTLVARSTIGGLVFTVSVVMMLELAAGLFFERVLGIHVRSDVFANNAGLQIVRATYAVLTLALGWLVFARFQAAGAGFGAASGTADGWAILRARRGQLIGNIIRKELMLQRPTFMAAAAFVACWLVALVVIRMQSRPGNLAEVLQAVLIAGFMTLVVVLAGTISAGEDASLGIKAWHLALPLAARTQWALKLVVALVVGVGLATVVPWLMVAVADLVSKDHINKGALVGPSFIWFIAGAVALAFWASTLLGDTVKASLTTGGMIVLMGTGSAWAVDYATRAGRHMDWLSRLLAPLNISPQHMDGVVQGGIEVVLVVIGLTALWQSLSACGRVRTPSASFLRMALVLLVVAVAAAFCLGLFLTAIEINFFRRVNV